MEILPNTGPQAEKFKNRLNQWLESVPQWHDNFVWTPNEKPAWCAPGKPLAQSTVALIGTGGFHLKNQPPFDVDNPFGDASFRLIPACSDPADIAISHTHYDHSEADHDINCMFPITRLWELKEQGVIGDVAENFYGLNGFIPNPARLISETAPQILSQLKKDSAEVVLLTPDSANGHRAVGLLQDAFEKAGIVTISITLKPEVTLFMNIPRAAYIRYPYGYSAGPAFQPDLQREIIRETLLLIDQISKPGTVVKLPYRWSGVKGDPTIQSAEPRTQLLINGIDEMIKLLEEIVVDMQNAQQTENSTMQPDPHKLAFYQSQVLRARKLASLFENEAIDQVHSIRNLSGPIKYLREEQK